MMKASKEKNRTYRIEKYQQSKDMHILPSWGYEYRPVENLENVNSWDDKHIMIAPNGDIYFCKSHYKWVTDALYQLKLANEYNPRIAKTMQEKFYRLWKEDIITSSLTDKVSLFVQMYGYVRVFVINASSSMIDLPNPYFMGKSLTHSQRAALSELVDAGLITKDSVIKSVRRNNETSMEFDNYFKSKAENRK